MKKFPIDMNGLVYDTVFVEKGVEKGGIRCQIYFGPHLLKDWLIKRLRNLSKNHYINFIYKEAGLCKHILENINKN